MLLALVAAARCSQVGRQVPVSTKGCSTQQPAKSKPLVLNASFLAFSFSSREPQPLWRPLGLLRQQYRPPLNGCECVFDVVQGAKLLILELPLQPLLSRLPTRATRSPRLEAGMRRSR